MNVEFKKGKKYLCEKWEGNYFTVGKQYVSDRDYHLKNDKGVSLMAEGCGSFVEVKEETFRNTESQINDIYHFIEYQENADKFMSWFPDAFEVPEAFESEVKLEAGKWYKNETTLFCITEFDKDGFPLGYGFSETGKWLEFDSQPWCREHDKEKVTEATEQEVFEALRVEALKRYKVGDWVKSFFHNGNPVLCISETDFGLNGQKGINCKGKTSKMPVVYSNGQWAEIIPTITLSEAEQKLGKKIIV